MTDQLEKSWEYWSVLW